ncbi:serine/threonine protein phosphatase [Puteibacter caeruleilacunae]|nr:serine/threonine protein phosphatase [Puteibacter caeruleilacunae]
MRRLIFTLFTLICFYCAANAQSGKPKLENEDSWTMIVLSDPQSYAKFERNQPVFSLMTRWIKQYKEKLNIELVMCEGDLVEQNNIQEGDGRNGDQNSTQQWKAIREAFSVLDTVVPYILSTGNHDYGTKSAENRYTQLNAYFPPHQLKATQDVLAGMMPNAVGEKTLENAYYEFTSPHGIKYLILSLEFNPRATIVKQAKEIVSREKYADHKGIVMTHSYMRAMSDNNVLIEKEGYKVKDVTHGKKLWEQLIAPSSNIEMVLCGHIGGIGDFKKNVGYRVEPNAAGKNVHQMLFNAQTDGGGWFGNGGDGWLRILEFLPDGKTVIVKTFSPFFAFSPTTIDEAWRNEPYDSFTIELSE